jgi:hypothetical protein
MDGMVCINDAEFQKIVSQDPGRSWLRAERKKGELYTVSGANMELLGKRPNGISPIIQALQGTESSTQELRTSEPPRSSSAWLKRLLRRWWAGSDD